LNRKALPLAVTLAAVLAIFLLLSGCGGEKHDSAELLDQAAQNAREAGTVHAQLNVVLTPLEGESGMGINVQGDAWLDMDAKVMEARFTVLGMELSLRYVDDTAYLQLGEDWHILEGEIMAGIGEETIVAMVDALASYPDIFSQTSEVNELEEKKVGNYQCTNLEVVPDLEAIAALDAVQQLAADLDRSSEEIETYLRDADLRMEVCVQEDEQVMRQVFLAADLDLPEMGQVMGIPLLPSNAHLDLTIDISEYGVKVEVQPPPEATPFQDL
jgi:hypothetical protein